MTSEAFEPAEFARTFQEFLDAFRQLVPPARNEIRELVTAHLGYDPRGLPSFSEQFDPAEHQNLQLAFNEMATPRNWSVIGLPGDARNYGGFSLVALLAGRFAGAIGPASPEFINLPISARATLPCLLSGLFLAYLDDEPVVALLMSAVDRGPREGLSLEVLARDEGTVRAFLTRVRERMQALDVYRGKLLAFTYSEWGRVGLGFVELPAVTSDEIVLPAEALDAMERHTVGVSERADALVAAGQHLKRGLLLYGPPGTGKTYSVMYLCNCMPGRTTVMLTGPATHALGRAMAVARNLQPSMVVLEDVDLVATDRDRPGMDENPLLFQLLNEMDGLASDADIVFVLTTNRVDILEPALSARPGRIDQAIEIGLPDAHDRRRLLDLYLRAVPCDAGNLDAIAARMEGASAAFVKELVRRATIAATDVGATPGVVRDEHLDVALADLIEHSAPITRAILGAAPSG